ncbi:MAG: hemolysin family protein [Candidatus Omnitrophota bacterium]
MITIYVLLIIGAVLTEAFFAASETALTSVSKIKINGLAAAGDEKAQRLNVFLHKKGAYLGTTLVGTNVAVVTTAALATRLLSEHFDPDMVPLLVTVIIAPIALLFAEIMPKMIAYQFSKDLAMNVVYPLIWFSKIFHPIIITVNSVSSFLLRPLLKNKTSWEAAFTRGDIKKLLLLGHETGEVEADEVELIHKVLDFGNKKVKNTMIPLYGVSSVEKRETIGNLKKLVSLTGFSRVPVYDEKKNNIVGIVNIYDILFGETEDRGEVNSCLREGAYIKRDDPLDIALARLRNKKQPMGIVLDENEKACGIITLEDILEEIVGNIEDTAQGEEK